VKREPRNHLRPRTFVDALERRVLLSTWTTPEIINHSYGSTRGNTDANMAVSPVTHLPYVAMVSNTNDSTWVVQVDKATRKSDGTLDWSGTRNTPIEATPRAFKNAGPTIAIGTLGGQEQLHIAYFEHNGTAPAGQVASEDIMYVRSNNGGATWSAPLNISNQGITNSDGTRSGRVGEANIAADDQGNVYVAWNSWSGEATQNNLNVWFRKFNGATQQWEPAYRIETNDASKSAFVQLFWVPGTGRIHAVWGDRGITPPPISYAVSNDYGATFSAPQTVFTAPLKDSTTYYDVRGATVTENADGTVIVGAKITNPDNSTNTNGYMAYKLAGSNTWNSIDSISNTSPTGSPYFTADRSGRTYYSWIKNPYPNSGYEFNFRYRDGAAAQSFDGAPNTQVTSDGLKKDSGQVGVDIRATSSTDVFAAWEATDGVHHIYASMTNLVAPTATFQNISTPRGNSVQSAVVDFSETVSGVDLSDFTLTRNGNAVSLSGASLSTSDNKSFTVNGLGPITTLGGTYVLTVKSAGTGIADSFANPLAADANVTWFNSATNAAPTLTSLTDSPDPVNAGAQLTLTANGVSDADGETVTVAFYRESNSVAGLQTGAGGDTPLGSKSAGPYSIAFAAPAPGSYTFYAQGTDASSLTSPVASTTTSVVSTAPAVGALSDSPDPVDSSQQVTLSASGVSDAEGDAVTVNFYRESNGVSGLQVGGDTLVGSDNSNPCSITISPGSPGTFTYYAQASDVWGLAGNVVSTTNTVLTYSVTPGTPNLLSASDTGSSAADDYTRFDNSSAGTVLKFTVGSTIVGATVTLYADGSIPFGTLVATSTISTVTTNGTVDLSDGAHPITARQTEPGKSESLPGAALNVTIDTAAPTADVVDVSPDPRNTSVASVAINFDGSVSGFDYSDLTLKRDGGANLITSSNAPTTGNSVSFTVPNLATPTGAHGTYVLSVNGSGSGIVDQAGNAMTSNPSDAWSFLPPWLSVASQAAWNAAGKILTVNGPAEIVADPGPDNPTVNADGAGVVLTIDPATDMAVHVSALNLTNGASAALSSLGGSRTASHHRVLVTNSINIDAASTLDLADNDLIVDYTGASSPRPAIEAMVSAGFNLGDWLGKRITSSVAALPSSNANFALGVAENKDLAVPFGNGTTTGPQFAGQSVDNTVVLIKFTHRVDLDLDGLITGNDAAFFNGGYSEDDLGATWLSGDIDLDGLWSSNDASIFNSFYDESLGAI
jgi:hypothetical protein